MLLRKIKVIQSIMERVLLSNIDKRQTKKTILLKKLKKYFRLLILVVLSLGFYNKTNKNFLDFNDLYPDPKFCT